MSGPRLLSGGDRHRRQGRPGRRRGRPRRRRPPPRRPGHRRRRRLLVAAAAFATAVVVLLVAMAGGTSGPSRPAHAKPPPRRQKTSARAGAGAGAAARAGAGAGAAAPAPTVPATYGVALAPPSERVQIRLRKPLRSGMLFDVHTGRVLWERGASAVLPIASLTKMMTALIVATLDPPKARVLITRAAVDFSGSGVGLLPLHKRVPLEALLYGLMLPSGNDAAIALAQHVAGTQVRFIAMMNARAQAMGLSCTHFTTESGVVDAGNYSCAPDLAKLARAVLDVPRLARIVASPSAVIPFPIKGHKLYLYNNNPLYRLGYPGTDGIKTGYTTAAGVCLVATARRGRTRLGVVLLHSADEIDQAPELLNAGFAAMRGA